MSRIVFLSMDVADAEHFFVYDDLLIPHFNEQGYVVDTISWRAEDVDWNDYDHVIVRSPWDYQQAPEAFIACLQRIEASSAQLHNPLALMLWNIEKTYLKDLAHAGVPIVPTQWCEDFNPAWLVAQFEQLQTNELVIKPALSANADDTFRVTKQSLPEQSETFAALFRQRLCMVQPFLHAVVEEGEYSLFYFAGEYSHGLLKQPKAGDFRVQEEHGGRLSAYTPDAAMLAVCEQALAAMPTKYLYARVDLIRVQDSWAIMELELIEPSLYFNIDDTSPARFVAQFVARHGRGKVPG